MNVAEVLIIFGRNFKEILKKIWENSREMAEKLREIFKKFEEILEKYFIQNL